MSPFFSVYYSMLWCAVALCAIQLSKLDYITTRTTMRLWHSLHVAEQKEHEFEFLFAPSHPDCFHIGAIVNGEVHAIARCRHASHDLSGSSLVGVAHAPHQDGFACEMVRLLAENCSVVSSDSLARHQPRMAVAHMFYGPPTNSSSSSRLLRG